MFRLYGADGVCIFHVGVDGDVLDDNDDAKSIFLKYEESRDITWYFWVKGEANFNVQAVNISDIVD